MKLGSLVKDLDGDVGKVTMLEHDWVQVTYPDGKTFGWSEHELKEQVTAKRKQQ